MTETAQVLTTLKQKSTCIHSKTLTKINIQKRVFPEENSISNGGNILSGWTDTPSLCCPLAAFKANWFTSFYFISSNPEEHQHCVKV